MAELVPASGRRLLGLAGPPGAGKSTLAESLVRDLPAGVAVVVPLDGFHLAQAELVRLGRAERKGAPDTFDVAGFVALLQRIRAAGIGCAGVRCAGTDEANPSAADTENGNTDAAGTPARDVPLPGPEDARVVYAPAFRREWEEPVAGAIPVGPGHRLVVVEGNYLLLDGPWAPVRTLLDECWYLDLDDEERVRRLVARHEHFGREPQEARAWVMRSDEANARQVTAARGRADRVLRLG